MQNAAWSHMGFQQGTALYGTTYNQMQTQYPYYSYASSAAPQPPGSYSYPQYPYPFMPQSMPGFPMPFAPSFQSQLTVQEPQLTALVEEQPLPPGVDPVKPPMKTDERVANGQHGMDVGEKYKKDVGSDGSDVMEGKSVVGKEVDKKDKVKGKGSQQEEQQQHKQKNEGFPPALNEYVLRCFQSCVSESEKNQMEGYLKKLLSDAFNSGSAWLKDWTKESLPQLKKGQKKKSRWATPPPSALSLPSSSLSGGFVSSGRGFVKVPPAGRGKVFSQGRGLGVVPGVGSRGRDIVKRGRDVGRRSRSRSSSLSSDTRSPYRSRKHFYSSDSGSRSNSPSALHVSPIVKPPQPKKKQKRKQKKSKVQKKFSMEKDEVQMSERLKRFGDMVKPQEKKKTSFIDMIHQMNNRDIGDDNDFDWSQYAIHGTCQKLDKPYFRLTAAPDASLVRPVDVLRRSVQMVKDKWNAKSSYRYVCEQFKSIRQDLTVQCIRDEFTVEVYETHARVALEQGDREEFNQCLTQLRTLYSEDIAGNEAEFTAYWILYLMLTRNSADMNVSLASLSDEMQSNLVVKHALALRSAWALSNYHKFFKLYISSPLLCPFLIDMFIQRERLQALRAITKSFRPTVPVSFLQTELGFDSVDKCRSFLQENGGIRHGTDDNTLDCKLTHTNLLALSQLQS